MKIIAGFVVSLLLAVPLVARAADTGFGSLTPQEVFAKLKQKNVYVFDNNDPEMFKGAHVPGAKWVHPSEYDAKSLPADKSATLIFYCMNEHWHACHEGAGRALKLGYKNVFIMPAGIQGWQKAGLPTEKG